MVDIITILLFITAVQHERGPRKPKLHHHHHHHHHHPLKDSPQPINHQRQPSQIQLSTEHMIQKSSSAYPKPPMDTPLPPVPPPPPSQQHQQQQPPPPPPPPTATLLPPTPPQGPVFLGQQQPPPPPGLLQILMSAEKCQVKRNRIWIEY